MSVGYDMMMTRPATTAAENWFAAQLKPNGLSQALAHLHRQGFATFSPMMKSTKTRAGRRVEARTPLFSGYVFVNFDPVRAGWSAINSTRGIARLILSNAPRPAPLPHQLMAGLLARCDETGLLMPPADLRAGDRVRILSGPFAECVSQIEQLKGQDRVGLLIRLMGRDVRSDVAVSNVVKLA